MFRLLLRMSYYAVAKGRNVGIFSTWAECENQVKGFSGAVFKKFKTNDEALSFIRTKSTKAWNPTNQSTSRQDEEPVKKKLKCDDMTEKEMIDSIVNYDEIEKKKAIKPRSRSSSRNRTKPQNPQNSLRTKNAPHPLRIKMTLPQRTSLKTYGNYQFQEDDKGFVHVYTDGSCENNGKKSAVAGFGVYFDEDHPLNASEPVTGRPTNNSGEIQAAIRAIYSAQSAGVKRLNIFSDSQFLINSVCKWFTGWKHNNWTLKSGKPVANSVDYKKLDELIESGNMLIKWSYIAAHKGHEGNEAADRLAKEGAQKYKKK